MSSTEFEAGDQRDDRGPARMFSMSSETLEDELGGVVNEELTTPAPELEEVLVTDNEPKKRKLLTVSNVAGLVAVGFVIWIGYAVIVASYDSPAGISSEKPAAANKADRTAQVKNATPTTMSNPTQVTDGEMDALRKEVRDLRKELGTVSMELASSRANVSHSADLEGRLAMMETYVSELQKVKQLGQPTDNDVITRVMSHVIPEIKKYSDSNAARIRKELAKKLEGNTSEPANGNNARIGQNAAKAPTPTMPQVAKDLANTNTPASTQVNGAQARDLVFVMATNDLMLVTAKGDESQRIITLKPDEFVKGRGIIESISPRGCIQFQDGSTYEVLNREGSCTKAQ